MKSKKNELEVDFIGGEGSLTAVEQKALSDFFKQRKSLKKSKTVKRAKKVQKSLALPV